jgi:hypothetical protein
MNYFACQTVLTSYYRTFRAKNCRMHRPALFLLFAKVLFAFHPPAHVKQLENKYCHSLSPPRNALATDNELLDSYVGKSYLQNVRVYFVFRLGALSLDTIGFIMWKLEGMRRGL